jgi:hypothetical protein
MVLAIVGPTPTEPVCRQYTQADDNKVLLEIKETHRMPMAVAF